MAADDFVPLHLTSLPLDKRSATDNKLCIEGRGKVAKGCGGMGPVLTSPIDQEVREVGEWSLVKCCLNSWGGD